MKLKVRQVGDTLVLTIPKAVATARGITRGQQVELFDSGTKRGPVRLEFFAQVAKKRGRK